MLARALNDEEVPTVLGTGMWTAGAARRLRQRLAA